VPTPICRKASSYGTLFQTTHLGEARVLFFSARAASLLPLLALGRLLVFFAAMMTRCCCRQMKSAGKLCQELPSTARAADFTLCVSSFPDAGQQLR
jgi:hypothetical protein